LHEAVIITLGATGLYGRGVAGIALGDLSLPMVEAADGAGMLFTEVSDHKPAGGLGIDAASPNGGHISSGILGHKST